LKNDLNKILLSVALVNQTGVAFAETTSPVTDMVMRGATGLALCLCVFGVAVFLMKRTSSQLQNTRREIIVKDRVGISPKSQAVLIEIRGQMYLMVSGSENVSITPIPLSDSVISTDGHRSLPSERLLRVGGE